MGSVAVHDRSQVNTSIAIRLGSDLVIIFKCPRCHDQLEVPNSLAGNVVTCPTCSNVNTVPSYHSPPTHPAQVVLQMPPPPACSRAVYIILALFLGSFGIHNFVAGRTGCAIAQLLITLFTFWLILPLIAVGIWVLVEICAVTHDGRGIRM